MCTDAEWQSTAATSTTDRVCSALTVCVGGEYQSAPHTSNSDRQCAACNALACTAGQQLVGCGEHGANGVRSAFAGRCEVICKGSYWETQAQVVDGTPKETAQVVQHRVCKAHTVCTESACKAAPAWQTRDVPSKSTGWYYSWTMVAEGEQTAMDKWCDYQCTRPTPYCPKDMCNCPGAQYESQAAGTHQDRKCDTHTKCTVSQVETKAAGTHSDRECAECATISECVADHSIKVNVFLPVPVAEYSGERQHALHQGAAKLTGLVDDAILFTVSEVAGGVKVSLTAAVPDAAAAQRTIDTFASPSFRSDLSAASGEAPWLVSECNLGQWAQSPQHIADSAMVEAVCLDHSSTCTSTQWEKTEPGKKNDRDCMELTTCATGGDSEYESVTQTATSDRVCLSHTECADNHFASVIPTLTSDRQCSQLTECTGQQFATKSPTATSDRVCQTYMGCTSQQYISMPGGSNFDRTCTALTKCTADVQFESTAPTTASNRQCTAITTCAAGQYEETAPSTTSDRICTDLSECADDQYESAAETATQDRVCSSHTQCKEEQYESTSATTTSDRVCIGHVSCTNEEYESVSASGWRQRQCSPINNCLAGRYEVQAPTATSNRVCLECSEGKAKASAGQTACTSCVLTAGEYQDQAGQSSCKALAACNAGYVRAEFSTTSAGRCVGCPAGQFKENAGEWQDDCSPCLAGAHAQSTASTACAPCTAGTYQAQGGQPTCEQCPIGRFSNQHGRINLADCTHCASGKYNDQKGSIRCLLCSAGTFGDASKTTSSASHCVSCPKGRFQEEDGSTVCAECESGQYQHMAGGELCHSCDVEKLPYTAGKEDELRYYWTAGKAGAHACVPKPLDCKPGSWASVGICSKSCGTGFLKSNRSPEYQAWGGGKPCKDFAWTKSDDCNSSACPVDCTLTSWSSWSSGDNMCSKSCGEGSQRRTRSVYSAELNGGKGCDALEQTQPCNTHACPEDCVVGAWATWSTCTKDCGTGRKTRTRTLTEPKFGGKACPSASDESPCNRLCCAGSMHVGTTYNCILCDKGKFSAAMGSMSCSKCAHGTYQSSEGATLCSECAAGTHNPHEGKTSDAHCTACARGQYQPARASKSCLTCAKGRFNPHESKAAASDCEACVAGTFAPTEGLAACKDCEVGRYEDKRGQEDCTDCPAGQFNKYTARSTASYCYVCGCGKWSVAGANVCADCPSGRFRGKFGAECTNLGATACNSDSSCEWFATVSKCVVNSALAVQGDSIDKCVAASAGHKVASEGSCAQTSCPVGRYQSAPGSNSCTACAAGRFSSAIGALSDATCNLCTAGKWSSDGLESCSACAAGKASAQPGLATITGCITCNKGYFAENEGATACLKCGTGTWQSEYDSSSCHACAAGKAHKFLAQTEEAACVECSKGHFQPYTGRAMCAVCAAGKFQDASGAGACKSCDKGSASANAGATTAASCAPCAAGSFADSLASTVCTSCAEGKFSPSAAATTALACVHCSAGQYAEISGMTACKKCAAGRFGQANVSGAADKLIHCLKCPVGQFQEADGMTDCAKCVSGTYAAVHHDMVQCHACSDLDVDSARKYTTRGMAGQSQCWPTPVDCQASVWGAAPAWGNDEHDAAAGKNMPNNWKAGAWGMCSKSCGTGKRTQTRHPLRQPAAAAACGLSDPSQCYQAWGGGAECDTLQWSTTQDCNEHACPVDCVVSQWGAWAQCTKTCGAGGTSRFRVVTTAVENGGKGCPNLRDPVQGQHPCNAHSCGWEHLPTCRLEHVRCDVQELSHHNSFAKRPHLPGCGWSVIEDRNTCWNNRNCVTTPTQRCHDADTSGERLLGNRLKQQYNDCLSGADAAADAARAEGTLPARSCRNTFKTLVVTHDRASMKEGGPHQRNGFHCKRDGAGGCTCTCNKHPACCSKKNKLLANTSIMGNKFDQVQTKQECCNLCTNHPQCTSWTWDSLKVCALKAGEPQMIENTAAGILTTWSGTPSGTSC